MRIDQQIIGLSLTSLGIYANRNFKRVNNE